MFDTQLKHVPSIRLFLVGLVILSLACHTAIRLLKQDSEPLPNVETTTIGDRSGVTTNGNDFEIAAAVTKSVPTSQDDDFSPSQINGDIYKRARDIQAAEQLPSKNYSEETLVTGLTALAIQKYGYGQNEQELAYAFLVHNSNQDLTIADSEYQVIAYDRGGRVVLRDSEIISYILPNQSLGIAGNLYLAEDIPIDDLEVQIQTGTPHFAATIPNLDVQAVDYRPGEYYDRVTGLIAGPKSYDVEDLRVSAIAYDSDGEIIGAGYSFVSFIKAGKATGVDITITNDGNVAQVELFPRLSLSFVDSDEKRGSKNVQELSLLQTDFVQNDLEVGYGFLFENPNQTLVAENSEYRMTAFDSAGNVILVDEGSIERVMPGQTFGFGSTFFVEEGEEVDYLDLQLKTSSFRQSELLPVLDIGNITILGDEYSSIVTGEIMNRHDQAVEDIRVFAIVFDANDQIVGGGFTWLDSIPAGDSSDVEVWVTSVGEPMSARFYASVGELMEIE